MSKMSVVVVHNPGGASDLRAVTRDTGQVLVVGAPPTELLVEQILARTDVLLGIQVVLPWTEQHVKPGVRDFCKARHVSLSFGDLPGLERFIVVPDPQVPIMPDQMVQWFGLPHTPRGMSLWGLSDLLMILIAQHKGFWSKLEAATQKTDGARVLILRFGLDCPADPRCHTRAEIERSLGLTRGQLNTVETNTLNVLKRLYAHHLSVVFRN